MKKALLRMLAVMLLAASCAGKRPVEVYDLEIVTFYDDTASSEAFMAIVGQFEKASKLRVFVESIPAESYYASLEQYMTSDYPPDMFSFHPGWHFRNYAARGFLEPVEQLLPGRKFEKSFPAQFREASSYNSSPLFVPLTWAWWSIYYNKKAFAAAGASMPASLDELYSLAPTLRKNGLIPFTASAKDSRALSAWLGLCLSAAEDAAPYRDFCSGAVPLNDGKFQTALQQFAMLVKNKYLIDSAAMLSREQALGPLLSGRATMYLADSGLLKNIPTEDKGNIGVAAFPGYKGKAMVYADLEGFVLHAKAQHKANAKKFLAFISSPEMQEAMSLPFARLPANLSGKQRSPELEAARALLAGARTAVVPMERNMPTGAAAAVLSELGNLFSLPGNLALYLQNLEAKRVEIFKIKN